MSTLPARRARRGIAFTKEGNCFTTISDAAGLAKIADTLSERLETLEKVADIRDVTRLLLKRLLPGTVTQAAKPSAAPAKGNTLLETGWVP
jgi:hypothetical protein